MSIMKRKMPMYRNVGGNVPAHLLGSGTYDTTGIDLQNYPGLPGQEAHTALRARTDAGTPLVNTSGSSTDVLNRLIDYSGDPRNTPDYYTGDTVAGFNTDQLDAFSGKRAAAGQTDALTNQLLGDYQAQLDPNSALNQRLAQGAAAGSQSTASGQGVLGSLRGQQASQGASRAAIDANRNKALQNIGALRGDLTAGSDILSGIGGEQQKQLQDVINEDIKRFNYAQLSPQQQLDRILSLVTARKGLEEGNVGLDYGQSGGGSKNIFSNLFGDIGSSLGSNLVSSLFSNEGGEVIDPNMPQDPMAVPGAPQDPMMGNEMPVDPMAAGGDPMAAGMPAPGPEMGMEDPMMSDPMMDEMDMMVEPQSEIDKVESAVEQLIATTGAPLTITRKTIIGKAKKGK